MTKIVFLGWLKDKAGVAERQVDLPELTTPESLIAFVAGDNAELASALSEPSIRIIINKSFLANNNTLPDNIDEVAFMPPLSGG